MTDTPKLLICGYTGSGKTTVGREIAQQLGAKLMDTFQVIAEDLEDLTGGSSIVIGDNKSALRATLKAHGTAMCKDDPAALVKACLAGGATIVGGCRRRDEFEAAKGLFDLTIWIDRPGVEKGETDEVELGDCNYVFFNSGTLKGLPRKVASFVKLLPELVEARKDAEAKRSKA